jgi:uncharacterized protein (DUF1778 family)
MAKKRGAPPKPASERKAAVVQIRLQGAEKAAFERAAKLRGLSLSAWMRTRLRDAAVEDLNAHGLQPDFLSETKKRRSGG